MICSGRSSFFLSLPGTTTRGSSFEVVHHYSTTTQIGEEESNDRPSRSGLVPPPPVGDSNMVVPTATRSHCPPPPSGEGRPYVKKWMKNRHAIMFQLSNKIVQVIFFDKTEVVLSSRAHMVTYVDKRGDRSAYPLQSVMEISNTELAKRLRYTKDILVNLLSGQRATATHSTSGALHPGAGASSVAGS